MEDQGRLEYSQIVNSILKGANTKSSCDYTVGGTTVLTVVIKCL